MRSFCPSEETVETEKAEESLENMEGGKKKKGGRAWGKKPKCLIYWSSTDYDEEFGIQKAIKVT